MIAASDPRARTRSSRPRVGIDALLYSTAATYRGAGIANYIRNILARLPACLPEADLDAFLGEAIPSTDGMEAHVPRLPGCGPWMRILWEQTALPMLLSRRRADLLHSMAFALPLYCPCPSVVTIYDLSFLLYPDGFRLPNRLYLREMTRRAARAANAVIAISENTRSDIIRQWGIPADRVRVAPCGVDARFAPLPAAEVERFRLSHGLPEEMILFLGTLEPRKNLVTLIEAYALLTKRGLRHRLVIAGGKGWKFEPVFEAVERLGIRDRVLFPGFVAAQELPLWYNASTVFVYPSLYEGFGLPPLEAMACGTPVIVSDRASLPEIVGTDGIVVSATDPSALADAMHRVLAEAGLAERQSAQGLARSRPFTWDRAAQVTADMYRSILNLGA